MSRSKPRVINVKHPKEFFETEPNENEIITYTPFSLMYSPLRARLVKGQYGTTIQLVQFKPNSGFTSVSLRPQNIYLLSAAIAEISEFVKMLKEHGEIDETIYMMFKNNLKKALENL